MRSFGLLLLSLLMLRFPGETGGGKELKRGEELLSDTGKCKGEKHSEGGAKAAATATPWRVRAPNV